MGRNSTLVGQKIWLLKYLIEMLIKRNYFKSFKILKLWFLVQQVYLVSVTSIIKQTKLSLINVNTGFFYMEIIQ